MKKNRKITDILILVFAGVTLFNYIAYLVHLIAFPEQIFAFVITFIILTITALPIVFRKKLKAVLKKSFPFLFYNLSTKLSILF